jgi:hypothetical protein
VKGALTVVDECGRGAEQNPAAAKVLTGVRRRAAEDSHWPRVAAPAAPGADRLGGPLTSSGLGGQSWPAGGWGQTVGRAGR